MSGANKLKITTEMREILIGNAEVKKLIGDKIFPIIAQEGTKGDFIVYQRDEFSQEYGKMGKVSETCVVLLFVVSENYKRSQDIAALVTEVLEGCYSEPTMRIWLDDSTEIYEDEKYKQVLSFKID